MAHAPVKHPKSLVSRVLKWGGGIVLLILIFMGVRECSNSSSKEEKRDSAQVTAQDESGPSIRSPTFAEPIPMNDICAPYMTGEQMCPIEPTKGSGYTTLSRNAPNGAEMCFAPEFAPKGVPEKDWAIKEVIRLLEDGTEVPLSPDDAQKGIVPAGKTRALKIIPNKPIILTYYASTSGCK